MAFFLFFFFGVEEFEFTVKFKSETFLSPLYQRVFFIVVVDQTKWYLGGFFLFWTFSPSWQRNMYCYALFFSWTDINLKKEKNVHHHLCSMHIIFFQIFSHISDVLDTLSLCKFMCEAIIKIVLCNKSLVNLAMSIFKQNHFCQY